MIPLVAHAGHWLVQVAYFVPVVLFLIWLGWTVLRDRREEGEDVEAGGSDPQGSSGSVS